jgi:hypothetical protein
LMLRVKKRLRRELLGEVTTDEKLQLAGMEMKGACGYLIELQYSGPPGAPGPFDRLILEDSEYRFLYRRTMPQPDPQRTVQWMGGSAQASGTVGGLDKRVDLITDGLTMNTIAVDVANVEIKAQGAAVKLNKDGSMDVSGHLLARERMREDGALREALFGARHALQAICHVDVGRFWRAVF